MEYTIDSNGYVTVEFAVGLGQLGEVVLEFLAHGESKTIDYEEWLDTIGTEYPIRIETVVIDSVTVSGKNILKNKSEFSDIFDVEGVRVTNKKHALQFKGLEGTSVHGYMGVHNILVSLDVDLRMRY